MITYAIHKAIDEITYFVAILFHMPPLYHIRQLWGTLSVPGFQQGTKREIYCGFI